MSESCMRNRWHDHRNVAGTIELLHGARYALLGGRVNPSPSSALSVWSSPPDPLSVPERGNVMKERFPLHAVRLSLIAMRLLLCVVRLLIRVVRLLTCVVRLLF